MTDITTIVNDYIAGWNEGDAGRRRTLVAQTYTEDARYLDPVMAGEGHDGIAAMIAGAQQQFPGHRFVLADGPEAHHDRVRFTWHLVGPNGDGAPVAIGTDFARVAEDGRLADVTGFLQLTGAPAAA
jgi:ketosteroid isomerase-like protein